jgi:Double zinc ribbon
MSCPNCGTANSEGSNFCMSCGHGLSKTLVLNLCRNCGTAYSEGSKYCMSCGHDLSKTLVSPTHQSSAPAHPPAIAEQVHPVQVRSRPGKLLDRVDLLLALVATSLSVLASIISKYLLSQVSYPFPPFVLSPAGIILTMLVSFLGIIPVTIGVFRTRAIERKTKLKRLIQKERGFFAKVDGDVSFVLGKGVKQNAE